MSLSSPTLIKALFITNLILLSFSLFNISWDRRTLIQEDSPKSYQFTDPAMAYQILTQLDIHKPYNNGWNTTEAAKQYKSRFLGLTSDYKYCQKHREHYVNNPGYVFSQVNFMTGWDNLVRTQVLQVIGNDVMPNTSRKLSKKVKPRSPEAIDLKPDVNLLVTWAEMNYHRQVQTQYACLAQMSDHIPGLNSIKVKGNLSETITKYAVSTYKTRPQCFDSNRFFPKTYSLRSLEQCREFFEIFNSEEYQIKKAEQKIVYFRKMGSGAHGADGVFAVDDQEEISIRALYGNGALCGEIQDDNLMQYSVHNPMLLNGRKFDFRIYMLIASVNPKIVYYHDGLLRVSLTNYDINNLSKFSLMPNSDENDEVIRKARLKGDYKGKTAEEIREEYMWSLERLRDYLLENGYISDPEWLDTYLRPAFKKAMIHLVRMAGDDYLKISSVYELHGLDFILDENLKLWFIETNCRPAIEETTPFSRELFRKMFLDQYEIVIGLLRSRMKRVYEYVNHVIIRGEAVWGSDGKVHVKNKQDKLKEFKEVIKNYFEPEFEPRKGNSFSKIMDENLSGVERFSGLISKECL